ncbi:S8 family peptidase [Streptomyces sp. NPDC056367]|uniref:S8 family peptidase n=1 Tax=Streptomyces sp. NPDC056367 TaxID=3345797 RepID=UPI0035DF84FA
MSRALQLREGDLMVRRAWSRVTIGALVLTMCSAGGAWADVQPDAPWGLARISQREPVGPGPWRYSYDSTAGQGVDVYVVDTGIDTEHPELKGRTSWLANVTGDGTDKDCNGRGTHLAGTVGATTYGVAKKVTLYAVKVARCDGTATTKDLIEGINRATTNARSTRRPSVMLIGPTQRNDDALNQAANDAAEAGVVVVAPAGDESQDACNISPASARRVLTVGATNKNDQTSVFSNYGSCMHLLGPGEDIVSTWIGGSGATRAQSGTAMAAAHAAGLAAYLIALEGSKSPSDVKRRLQEYSTKGRLSGLTSGPNYLLFNNYQR